MVLLHITYQGQLVGGNRKSLKSRIIAQKRRLEGPESGLWEESARLSIFENQVCSAVFFPIDQIEISQSHASVSSRIQNRAVTTTMMSYDDDEE